MSLDDRSLLLFGSIHPDLDALVGSLSQVVMAELAARHPDMSARVEALEATLKEAMS